MPASPCVSIQAIRHGIASQDVLCCPDCRYVFENYGADDGEGYSWTSSACPLYSWGGLTGFIGLQHAGFYSTNGTATSIE